jgi:hypothetical protein
MLTETIMWLRQIMPGLDVVSSIQKNFDSFFTYPGGLDLEIEVGDGSFLSISLSVEDSAGEQLNMVDYSAEIKKLAAAGRLRRIVRGTIKELAYLYDLWPDPIKAENMKTGRNAIIAIQSDGTGLLFIADWKGNFYEPDHSFLGH